MIIETLIYFRGKYPVSCGKSFQFIARRELGNIRWNPCVLTGNRLSLGSYVLTSNRLSPGPYWPATAYRQARINQQPPIGRLVLTRSHLSRGSYWPAAITRPVLISNRLSPGPRWSTTAYRQARILTSNRISPCPYWQANAYRQARVDQQTLIARFVLTLQPFIAWLVLTNSRLLPGPYWPATSYRQTRILTNSRLLPGPYWPATAYIARPVYWQVAAYRQARFWPATAIACPYSHI